MTFLRRWLLAAAGGVAVALAFLGAILPGLPTTPFLLLAAYCLGRTYPAAARRVLAHPLFRPYRRFLDGTEPIPPRVRAATIAFVWVAVSLSAWLLHRRDALPPWLAMTLAVAAAIGSVVIWRFRRRPPAA